MPSRNLTKRNRTLESTIDAQFWHEHIAEWNRALRDMRFGEPVTHVYNPLDYAQAVHLQYLGRFATRRVPALLVGMNPGPWGMAQTGVPFGEVNAVRDWMELDAPITPPVQQHPRRPILGLECTRSEVSGARLWGWARNRFGTPDQFFQRFFVGNYCPLAFLEESGRNRTPDKLSAPERQALFAICDRQLRTVVEALEPKMVVGIGRFAADRARVALHDADVAIGQILHPSPASPAANRDWAGQVEAQLRALGLLEHSEHRH